MKTSKKLSKEEIEQAIDEIFSSNPSDKQIKKAKILARSKNIKLKKYKQKFCKSCLTYFNSLNHQVRIKKPLKIIKCLTCNNISRYKIN
jgi:RNase P subunit RPR2|tara:strand:- start:807 stop:1073 length:267 start_codon:yes stop_codon:yes gene_type:complete